MEDIKTLFNLLELIHRNNVKVKLYNYYKGLSIVHDAVITDIKNESVVLKTDYLQQKAIHLEGRTLIKSDVLPNDILCEEVSTISLEKQTVTVKKIHFVDNSPSLRKTIRLLPDDKHSVSIFIDNARTSGNMRIEDISLDSVKLKFDYMPVGMKQNRKVFIDMVLSYYNKPLIINTEAVVFRTIKNDNGFSIIFLLKLDSVKKDNLLKYITARQIEIIKEFKSIGSIE